MTPCEDIHFLIEFPKFYKNIIVWLNGAVIEQYSICIVLCLQYNSSSGLNCVV